MKIAWILLVSSIAGAVPIKDLHPTQFVLGMREVEKKAHKLQKMSQSELDDYLSKKPAPVVLGPNRQMYLTDRHHLARELSEIGAEEIDVTVVADLSNLSVKDFWQTMQAKNWVYPYDENGRRQDPSLIPAHVTDLKDDPYRSLEWVAGKQHCFKKQSDVPFWEFAWVEFFRSRVKMGSTDAEFSSAVDAAMKLCHSPQASGLPGFIQKP